MRINFVDYLIKHNIFEKTSRRKKIALKVLSGEMPATVDVPDGSPPPANTSALLRRVLSGNYGDRRVSPAQSPKHRAELTKLADGKEADMEVLRGVVFDVDDNGDAKIVKGTIPVRIISKAEALEMYRNGSYSSEIEARQHIAPYTGRSPESLRRWFGKEPKRFTGKN